MRQPRPPFLDTNILLRHLLGDHPQQSPRATSLIAMIERGEQRVITSELVVFEAVFTLARTYKQPPDRIREALLAILELPGIQLPGKRGLRRAFDLYVDLNQPFADAYHAAFMERLGIDQVLSFDRDFDRVLGIERLEP
jgi:predicted nucleic acid-binding protein